MDNKTQNQGQNQGGQNLKNGQKNQDKNSDLKNKNIKNQSDSGYSASQPDDDDVSE